MDVIDNINSLLGDDLKHSLPSGSKLKIAASCFSIYAYEALKSELAKVDSLEFIFFIYEDDFAENTDEFLKRSNQKDAEGNRLVANTESNGRFHSDWLSIPAAAHRIPRQRLCLRRR